MKNRIISLLFIPFLLSACGSKNSDSTIESVDVHTHSYSESITKEPTCTEEGIRTFTCECGSSYTETIAKLNHTFNQQNTDDKYLAHEATCTEPAYYFYSCTCGEMSTETFSYGQALNHNYVLTEDELYYECNRCHDRMASGKGEYNVESKTKTYLFVGSSIANGYHGPSATTHSSMADMFKDDYLEASYNVYHNGTITQKGVYMRKISEVSNNTDGVGGTYSFDYDQVTLDGNGNGVMYGQSFQYSVKDGYISLSKPVGYIYNFTAIFNKGDSVYKYAADGYTLSDYFPRYASGGNQITWRNSYVGLMEDAIKALKDTHIDRVIIQLSTNDIGQFIDPECTTHLNFGNVAPNDQFSSSSFDKNTSYGALEWLLAIARETWDAEVSIFTVHMSTSEYGVYKANNYDSSKVTTTYKEMYDTTLRIVDKWSSNKVSVINLWNNKGVNDYLNSNPTRYYADTLHLTEVGYEAVLYQAFRNFFSKGEF